MADQLHITVLTPERVRDVYGVDPRFVQGALSMVGA